MKSKILTDLPEWNVEIKVTGGDSYLLAEPPARLLSGDSYITLTPDQRASSYAEGLSFYDFKVNCGHETIMGATMGEEFDKKAWSLLEKVFTPLGFKPPTNKHITYGQDTETNQFAPLPPFGSFSFSDLKKEVGYFHIRVNRDALLENLHVNAQTSN